MHELPQTIPDEEVILALEPEELAAKMLFLLRERGPSQLQNGMFHPHNLAGDVYNNAGGNRHA